MGGSKVAFSHSRTTKKTDKSIFRYPLFERVPKRGHFGHIWGCVGSAILGHVPTVDLAKSHCFRSSIWWLLAVEYQWLTVQNTSKTRVFKCHFGGVFQRASFQLTSETRSFPALEIRGNGWHILNLTTYFGGGILGGQKGGIWPPLKHPYFAPLAGWWYSAYLTRNSGVMGKGTAGIEGESEVAWTLRVDNDTCSKYAKSTPFWGVFGGC